MAITTSNSIKVNAAGAVCRPAITGAVDWIFNGLVMGLLFYDADTQRTGSSRRRATEQARGAEIPRRGHSVDLASSAPLRSIVNGWAIYSNLTLLAVIV
jgi:hypothetical protein